MTDAKVDAAGFRPSARISAIGFRILKIGARAQAMKREIDVDRQQPGAAGTRLGEKVVELRQDFACLHLDGNVHRIRCLAGDVDGVVVTDGRGEAFAGFNA